MSQQSNYGADFFAGLIFGLLLGAALAILAGPRIKRILETQPVQKIDTPQQPDANTLSEARQRAKDIANQA